MVRLVKKKNTGRFFRGHLPDAPYTLIAELEKGQDHWQLYSRDAKHTTRGYALKLIAAGRKTRKANYWLLWTPSGFIGKDAILMQKHRIDLFKWCIRRCEERFK